MSVTFPDYDRHFPGDRERFERMNHFVNKRSRSESCSNCEPPPKVIRVAPSANKRFRAGSDPGFSPVSGGVKRVRFDGPGIPFRRHVNSKFVRPGANYYSSLIGPRFAPAAVYSGNYAGPNNLVVSQSGNVKQLRGHYEQIGKIGMLLPQPVVVPSQRWRHVGQPMRRYVKPYKVINRYKPYHNVKNFKLYK